MNEKILKELEDIVNRGLADSYFPLVTKNSIRIKHMLVRKSKSGYLVIDTKEGKQIAFTEFKSTALALAKTIAKGLKGIDEILNLEHYHDAMFYENTINKTKDNFVRETRKVRLDIALEETQRVRKKIDYFIFS
jgi:hypothetical protein